MLWNPKNRVSNNELGEYLPDDQAQPYEESETIQAKSRDEAEEKCEETAVDYGGIDPKVDEVDSGNGFWDCKFKLWR